MAEVSLREISLLRITAQGLTSAISLPTPKAVVTHMLAVQGQQVSALPHALLSRCPDATYFDVERAFSSGDLIRHRPMRGTVHVTAAEDYHWLRLTLRSRLSAHDQRMHAEIGLTDADFDAASELALAALHSPTLPQAHVSKPHRDSASSAGVLPKVPSLRRKELFQLWLDNIPHPQVPDRLLRRWCNCLMWELDRRGVLVEGPLAGNEHLFIDATQLPGVPANLRLATGASEHDIDRQEAIKQIAYRYVVSHGPVSATDFARWIGTRQTSAREVLAQVATEFPHLLQCLTLPSTGETLYLRADLPDLLAATRAEAEQLMFLASFDELYNGYQDRSCLTDAEGETLICPAKNGMFRPLLVKNGELIAVHPVKEGLIFASHIPNADRSDLQAEIEAATLHLRNRLQR